MTTQLDWYTGHEEREHGNDLRCWCRPVVVHRSKITGACVRVHRPRLRNDYPPMDLIAYACWQCDSPGSDQGELTFCG